MPPYIRTPFFKNNCCILNYSTVPTAGNALSYSVSLKPIFVDFTLVVIDMLLALLAVCHHRVCIDQIDTSYCCASLLYTRGIIFWLYWNNKMAIIAVITGENKAKIRRYAKSVLPVQVQYNLKIILIFDVQYSTDIVWFLSIEYPLY